MKICFVTSLFGSSCGDRPSTFVRNKNYSYYMFTDKDHGELSTSWDIINISDNPRIKNIACNIRKSRYAKFMSWELLESLGKKYDFIYYCDAHFSPKKDINWDVISTNVISRDFPFIQNQHELPYIRQNGIKSECGLIVSGLRDTYENMVKTLLFFNKKYPTIDLNYSQYFVNTMFGYNPNSSIARKFMKEFWDIYTTADITYRDQPLWNLLLLKNNVKPVDDNEFRSKFEETGKYGDHHYIKKSF